MYEKENKQIQFIHEQYINCKLGIEIPAILKVEQREKLLGTQLQGVNPARESNFEASKMLEKMGSGPLRLHAEKILHKVCAYQKERNKRLFGGGNLADPTNILLEEVKDWLFNRLSGSSCQDLKDEVGQRIVYLKNLEESDLFPAGNGEKHLASLLVEIKGILRDEVQIAIEKNIAEESAREEFQKLVEQSKQLVLHTIQYLYYVIREEASEACNLDDLRGLTTDQKMQKSLQTQTGKLLKQLANAESVKQVFSNEETTKDDRVSQIAYQGSSTSTTQEKKAIVESLKSVNEVSAFNHKLLKTLTTSKEETGVHSSFLMDTELLLAFIELHGLVEALANFSLVCKKFHTTAGDGGDIIIYGFANQSMQYFMRSYFPLVKSLFSKITLINKKIDPTYKVESTSKVPWVSCYRKAGDFCAHMQKEKAICDTYAGKMLHKVEIGIDEKRRLEIQAQVQDSIASAQFFSERMYEFFPKELSPPPIIQGSSPMLIRTHSDSKNEFPTPRSRPSIETPKPTARPQPPMPSVGVVIKEVTDESNTSKSEEGRNKQGARSYAENSGKADNKASSAGLSTVKEPKRKNPVPNQNYSTVSVAASLGSDRRKNEQRTSQNSQTEVPQIQESSSNDDEITFRSNQAAAYQGVLSQKRKGQTLIVNEARNTRFSVSMDQVFNIEYVRNFFKSFPEAEQLAFIDLYLSSIGKQKKMGKVDVPLAGDQLFSLDRFDEPDTVNFLQEFHDDKFFSKKVSPFCKQARHIILVFEQKEMEYEKPYVRDWLWEQRHQELFCLKYLCVDAVKRSEDAHLALFISDLQFFSEESMFYSRYHALKKELINLNRARVMGESKATPSFNSSVDENLVTEKEEFRKEASKVDHLQKEFMKEKARAAKEKAEEKAKADRENARRDQEFAQRLEALESRISDQALQPPKPSGSGSCSLF